MSTAISTPYPTGNGMRVSRSRRAPNSPASGWAKPGEEREVQVEQRPRHHLGDAAALVGQVLASGAKRTVKRALDQRHPRVVKQRAQQTEEMVRMGILGVGVQEADEIAAAVRHRPPHGVALAQCRPVLGQQLILLQDDRVQRRRARRRAVARRRVDDDHLVDEPRRPCGRHRGGENPRDGVGTLLGGQHHGHRRGLLGGAQALQREGISAVAALLTPRRDGQVHRQPAPCAPVGASRGADPDVGSPDHRDAVAGQLGAKRLVLERSACVQAAHAPVGLRGHPQ